MKEIDNDVISIDDFQESLNALLAEYVAAYKNTHKEMPQDFPLDGVTGYLWYSDFDSWLEMRAARNEFCKHDT